MLIWLLLAALAPLLAPHDPNEQIDPAAARKRPPGTSLHVVERSDGKRLLADRIVERTPEHLVFERLGEVETLPVEALTNLTPDGVAHRRHFPLGSDEFGRDLASRILYGARVSLAIGLLAVGLAFSLGVFLGSVAATGPELLDGMIMRSVDALLAIPPLFLLLTLAALFQPGLGLLILILGGTSWMGVSRLVRAEVLGLRERDFIAAARGMGQGPLRILASHLLPNALGPILVRSTLLVGEVILVESSLSFLGLGVQPPMPSWGNIVAEGRADLISAWWISTFPGLAIAVTVIAFNLVGDGLRDRLDPHRR